MLSSGFDGGLGGGVYLDKSVSVAGVSVSRSFWLLSSEFDRLLLLDSVDLDGDFGISTGSSSLR